MPVSSSFVERRCGLIVDTNVSNVNDFVDTNVSIAVRLKEERTRLGYSQAEFAEIAGAHRKSQGNYESGERVPDAAYLAAIAAAGADVHYIVTGEGEVPASRTLTPDERVLLDGYRTLDPATRKRLLAFVLGGESPPAGAVAATVTQFIGGDVSGHVAGRDIVSSDNTAKGRRKRE